MPKNGKQVTDSLLLRLERCSSTFIQKYRPLFFKIKLAVYFFKHSISFAVMDPSYNIATIFTEISGFVLPFFIQANSPVAPVYPIKEKESSEERHSSLNVLLNKLLSFCPTLQNIMQSFSAINVETLAAYESHIRATCNGGFFFAWGSRRLQWGLQCKKKQQNLGRI